MVDFIVAAMGSAMQYIYFAGYKLRFPAHKYNASSSVEKIVLRACRDKCSLWGRNGFRNAWYIINVLVAEVLRCCLEGE